MSNEKKVGGNALYSLIPLEDFKAVLGVDDREDKIARFCLVTSTFSIEQFCRRRLLRKTQFECIDFYGDLVLPLKEYPVIQIKKEKLEMNNGAFLDPGFYRVIPDCGTDIDIPFSIELSPEIRKWRDVKFIKVVYWAGYTQSKVPPDLASACMELAAWNMNRYRGRRIGMTGNVRGGGKDGEHFELSMPVQVRQLLEPYKRKVI